MLAFSESQIITWVGQYFWPLTRITAFFMAAPIFGTRLVSMRVRLVLGVSLTLLVAPLITPSSVEVSLDLSTLLVVIHQFVIGFALAFIFQVVFQIFILSGQYVAMTMGLGFASMNDPANGVSITIVSQFYLLCTTLLFISIDGHLALIQILVDSFTILPLSTTSLEPQGFQGIAVLGSWMFASALGIGLPVLISLLLVNMAFGVMSRSAPQMNIFAVGFPFTLTFGLFIIWVGFSSFLPVFQGLVEQGMMFSQNILEHR